MDLARDVGGSTRTSRRRFLAGSGIALAAASSLGLPHPATATPPPHRSGAALTYTPAVGASGISGRRRPNIVLILTDDLGYGELGAYGQRLIATPNLDRLAAEGMRFTDFYTSAPICAPSRCSLLTGLHLGHSTVRHNPGRDTSRTALSPRDVTFAEVLQSVGYRTACYGKWGLGPEEPGQPSHPNARGFDEFFGYITHTHAHDYWPTYLWEDDRRVRYRDNDRGRRGTYAPDLFLRRGIRFIERNRDRPFLLFLSPNLPHAPHEVPSLGRYEAEPWTYGNKAHAAQITRLDAYVGHLVAKLRELGLEQDTLVLFSSDNGPHEEGGHGYDPSFFAGSGPLRGLKRNLYEGGIRVPLIAWGPGILREAPGAVSDHVWAMWDLYPTLAEIAGAPTPDDLDGVSARGVMTGRSGREPPERHLYWFRLDGARLPRSDTADRGRARKLAEAVRRGDWKAVRFAPGRDRYVPESEWEVELYDLRRDAGETTNVAAERPDVTAALVALMRASWEEPPAQRDSWEPHGLSADPPPFLVAGETMEVTTSFTNNGAGGRRRAELALDAPDGWTVEPLSSPRFRVVEPGTAVRTVWRVKPPPDARTGPDRGALEATVTYRRRSATRTHRLPVPVTVAPPAPTEDAYLSDLPWMSASNAWGPVERDRANGGPRRQGGPRIRLGRTEYRKGLGVHAPSRISYYLGRRCSRFSAHVGLDAYSVARSTRGSVTFYVFADDKQVYDSGVLTPADRPRSVDLDVSGVEVLHLVVASAYDTAFDHASWGDARVFVQRSVREHKGAVNGDAKDREKEGKTPRKTAKDGGEGREGRRHGGSRQGG